MTSPVSHPHPPPAAHAPVATTPASLSSSSPQLISLIRSLVGEQIKEWIETVHLGNIERSQRILQEQKETMNLIHSLSSYLQKIDRKLQNSNEIVDLLSKKSQNQASDILSLYEKVQNLSSPPIQDQQTLSTTSPATKEIEEILRSHCELKQQLVSQNEQIQQLQGSLASLSQDFQETQNNSEESLLVQTSNYFQTLHTELRSEFHSQSLQTQEFIRRTEKSFQQHDEKISQLFQQLTTASPRDGTTGQQQEQQQQLSEVSSSLARSQSELKQLEKGVAAELEVLRREQNLVEREMNLLRGEFQQLRSSVATAHHTHSCGSATGSPQRYPLALPSQFHQPHSGNGNDHPPLSDQEPQQQQLVLSPRTPYPHSRGDPSSPLGQSLGLRASPRYSDPSMTLHEHPHEEDLLDPALPSNTSSLHSFDSADRAQRGGPHPPPSSSSGARVGLRKSKTLQRQKTLSDELVALLDIISEKERDVKSASEKKTLIKNFIKGKLTEFQQKHGRYPTMEEKEAMAEIYFQHQEVRSSAASSLTLPPSSQAAILKEEAVQSLQDAKELLEEKRAELEQISFGEEGEGGADR
jgi:hypothetical protein